MSIDPTRSQTGESDIRFILRAVPTGAADRLQRRAVLYPLVGGISHSNQRDRTRLIKAKTNELLQLWRRRLHELGAAGWNPPNGHTDFQRNCRPSFAVVREPSRFCLLEDLCPHCYARRAAAVWARVDAGCPQPTLGQGYYYHLLLRDHTCYFDKVPVNPTDRIFYPTAVYQLRRIIARILADRQQYLERILRAQRVMGALWFLTIEPAADCWACHYRQLYKIPAAAWTLPGGQVRRIEQPGRLAVMRAVARTLRYPTLLFTSEPASVVDFLVARGFCRTGTYRHPHQRLLTSYGDFRGSSED
jgi:hypothetical protein